MWRRTRRELGEQSNKSSYKYCARLSSYREMLCLLMVAEGVKRCRQVSFSNSPLALAIIAMAVFFNCSFVRAAIKAHRREFTYARG